MNITKEQLKEALLVKDLEFNCHDITHVVNEAIDEKIEKLFEKESELPKTE